MTPVVLKGHLVKIWNKLEQPKGSEGGWLIFLVYNKKTLLFYAKKIFSTFPGQQGAVARSWGNNKQQSLLYVKSPRSERI